MIDFPTIHKINAAVCIVSGVWSIASPQTMLFIIRAGACLSEYDYAVDFLQAWGLFAIALGFICVRASTSTDENFQQIVAYAIVALTAAGILWDLNIALNPTYGPFGFFAAALNLFLCSMNATKLASVF